MRLQMIFTTFLLVSCSRVGISQSPVNIGTELKQTKHGTVNIFLANRHGLVAVTDSLLSADDVPVGHGQKLFRIDQDTICTIAGWYSSGTLATKNGMTITTEIAISDVINKFAEAYRRTGRRSLETTLLSVANAVGSTLSVVDEINSHAWGTINRSQSVISMARYEQGHLKIAHVVLTPTDASQLFTYEISGVTVEPNQNSMSKWVTGVPDRANEILTNPSRFESLDKSIAKYSRSLAAHGGSDLSILDLKALATELERETSKSWPNVVGGEVETAILTAHSLTITPALPRSTASDVIIPGKFMEMSRITYEGNGKSRFIVGLEDNQKYIFLANTDLHDAVQAIDHLFVFGGNITNSTLTYRGKGVFVLDSSNRIRNSRLVLGAASKLSPNEIARLQHDFPQLRIVPAASLSDEDRKILHFDRVGRATDVTMGCAVKLRDGISIRSGALKTDENAKLRATPDVADKENWAMFCMGDFVKPVR